MRGAALYDIHGNLHALDAVLAEPDVQQAALVVVGGDCVTGPHPRETLDRLLSLGERARFIRGNADRHVAESADAPKSEGSIDVAGHWVAQQLTREHLEFLASLPLTAAVEVEGLGEVLFCHATPRDDEEIFTRSTPDDQMREILRGVQQRVVVCGHTHVQVDRLVDGIRVVNAGSVGMPYEGRRGAFWALLGPGVDHRSTEYDVEAAAAVAAAGFDENGELFTRYVLEPPTAEYATETFERMARGE
jgi:predicted phosphodiesterase